MMRRADTVSPFFSFRPTIFCLLLFFYHFSLFILHQRGEGGKREMRGGRNSIGKREGGANFTKSRFLRLSNPPSLSFLLHCPEGMGFTSKSSYLTTASFSFYFENTNFPAKSSTFPPLQKRKYWSKISCCKFQPE